MKRHVALVLCLCIFLCSGCFDGVLEIRDMPHSKPALTAPDTETTVPTPTVADTLPTVAEPVETTAPPPPEPYLERILSPNHAIFSGPGFDYKYVGTVEKATNYTIMEEVRDDQGNLWGRLKSGVGWVNLTGNRSMDMIWSPIHADFADAAALSNPNTIRFTQNEEYVMTVNFQVSQTVYAVRLYNMELGEEDYVFGSLLYSIDQLTTSTPFVADLHLPGDMSMCAITFVDGNGITRYFYVADNLMDGSIWIAEFNV